MTDTSDFTSLKGARYLLITTFRPDGTEASTPVWFVTDDLQRRVLVATGADTWKVCRIKLNSHVRVAPCTAWGKPTGEPLEGTARIVDEEGLVRRLQREKYGWQRWLIENAYVLSMKLRRKPTGESVFLEIVPRRHDELAVRAA